ncbi:SIT4 phosphatase-associated protein-domain-containing protein [Phakopsora pachyrhizi]|uniref:SIT4 phosphatase-associated protein-domain-containing protein n=1 Tax=Phakopsora pachyrhizi TaxID=170000 RepID=A0AAV0B2B3_PHAPC|nr:SIT4 phosphatase-associated protein-domain-containing protein [Phakopsora pachyrhizi]
MAFWRFGFHSQSAIDSILSSSAANNHAHSNQGCSTPSTSSPAILLDKLLEEDDLLQEVKAQHPKLIEFLGTRKVVERMLGYISGMIFDDEDDHQTDNDLSGGTRLDRLSLRRDSSDSTKLSNHSPSSSTSSTSSSSSTATSSLSTLTSNDSKNLVAPTIGTSFFNSFRGGRVVGDTISSLLMDALDSEGRTPEDRAKAERRRVRFPYLCAEILASDLWSVTSQIFNDQPGFNLLTTFWDTILDQPSDIISSKTVQIGYWAKTNITLINLKPNEMMSFIKSYPSIIPKLLNHFDSSPVVDVMMRIIQTEETIEGTIDWLLDSTDFLEIITSRLHPASSPESHLTTAEFLKNVIAYCTTNTVSPSTPQPNPISKPMTTSTTEPRAGGSSPPNPSSLELNSSSTQAQESQLSKLTPLLSSSATQPTVNSDSTSDDAQRLMTTRLMRELSKPALVSKLLSFGLDNSKDEHGIVTDEKLTSSLVNSLSVLIDLIRRNNSDFSEHQLMTYLRQDLAKKAHSITNTQSEPESQATTTTLPSTAPRIVPLNGLLDSFGDRLSSLQELVNSPRSSLEPIPMVVGRASPLTIERFRIVELYAELLHCSNMGLLNRRKDDPGPIYDEDGTLIGGFEAFISIFNNSTTNSNSDEVDESPVEAEGDSNLDGESAPMDSKVTVAQVEKDEKKGDSYDLKLNEEEEEEGESQVDFSGVKDTLSPNIKPTASVERPLESLTSGERMKTLFIENEILKTCLDLFFEFPWNNFLHNVVYDLIQQTLNAKYEVGGGEISLKLTKSLFEQVKICDRLIEGVEVNKRYSERNNRVRLGNMAHIILIGDEIWKTLESNSANENPQDFFREMYETLKEDSRWMEFVRREISEARRHSGLALGGTSTSIPITGIGGLKNPVKSARTISEGTTGSEDESKLTVTQKKARKTRQPRSSTKSRQRPKISLARKSRPEQMTEQSSSTSTNTLKSEETINSIGNSKGEGFARYLVEQISLDDGTDKYSPSSSSSSSSEDEDDEDEEDGDLDQKLIQGVKNPEALADDDVWDQESVLSRNSNVGGSDCTVRETEDDGGGVISNPMPFGFDDRFDSPNRTFASKIMDYNHDQAESGFDDDFGDFEMPITNPRDDDEPERTDSIKDQCNKEKKQRLKVEMRDDGSLKGQDEEDWGEFSNPLEGRFDDENEREWNDFDLKLKD